MTKNERKIMVIIVLERYKYLSLYSEKKIHAFKTWTAQGDFYL